MIRKLMLAIAAALMISPAFAQIDIVVQPVLVAPAPGYFLCYDDEGVVYTIDVPCVFPLYPYPNEWIGVRVPHHILPPVIVRPPVVIHGPHGGPHHRR